MTVDAPEDLRARLAAHLSPDGSGWLGDALTRVAADSTAIRSLFPAAGRRCGRGELQGSGWEVDDAVRTLLLLALPLGEAELAAEVADLYRYGDAAEKRGVLRGLDLLDTPGGIGAAGLPLVQDALRTNDTRLITAGLGRYGARRLDAAAYRQGVLKCVFVGIPLAGIEGLEERADAELARMLADYARERLTAGRTVPADVWKVVDPDEMNPPREI